MYIYIKVLDIYTYIFHICKTHFSNGLNILVSRYLLNIPNFTLKTMERTLRKIIFVNVCRPE